MVSRAPNHQIFAVNLVPLEWYVFGLRGFGLTTGEQQVFDAYVIGSQEAPGIVVLQEWWGVDYEIKNHATAIAKKGYRALIPEYASSCGSRIHHLCQ